MPSPTAVRASLDHVQFTALPKAESSATSAAATTSAGGAGTTTTAAAAGAGSKLALTLQALSPFLGGSKLMAVFGAALGVIVVGTTLGVVLSENSVSTTSSSTFLSTSSLAPVSSSSPSSSSATSSSSSSSTSSSSPSSTSSSSLPSSSSSTTSVISTTVVTSSSTPFHPVCNETEFMCNNGQCLGVNLLCDGVPHCSDGSDEGVPCACSSYQFTCANGQCMPQDSRCNGTTDCFDKSDEIGCPDCSGFRCASNDLCLWDRMRHRCDGVFHCEDLSDEMNCPSKRYRRKCDNGVQIYLSFWCNGVDDCGDNSDEQNCPCESSKVACEGRIGRCISRYLRCDGFPDCDNGTDEKGCRDCLPSEFQCRDYSCVPISSRCNGKVDCRIDDADETGCFNVTADNVIHAMINGTMLPLCADDWTQEHSSAFCSSQRNGPLQTWTSSVFKAPRYATLEPGTQEVSIQHFNSSTECKSSKVVRVRCQDSVCGERRTPILTSFIAGGDITQPGKFPWVASLSYLQKPICGAAIIGRRWVLTAGHCVMTPVPEVSADSDFTSAPFYFRVTAGTTNITPGTTNLTNDPTLDTSSPSSHLDKIDFQTIRVSKIHLHPKIVKVTNGVDWDMALLELSSDLHFSDVVQPLCLPPEGKIFPRNSICYTAGWGMLSHLQYIRPEKLRETRMRPWSEERCRGNAVRGEKEVNTNSTICAGFPFGWPTACKGDSGAPLMCLEPGTSHWSLAGIMSRGENLCGRKRSRSLGNRFARVSGSVKWIMDTMEGV